MGRWYQTQLLRQNIFPVIRAFIDPATHQGGNAMAKPNYQFKKRQKELVKKKKKEEKRRRKLENKAVETDENQKEQTPVTEGQETQES